MNHGFPQHVHPSSMPYGVDSAQTTRQGQGQPHIAKPKRRYPSGAEKEHIRANPTHVERAPPISLTSTTTKRRTPKQKSLANQPQIEMATMVEPQGELPSTAPKRKKATKKAPLQLELVEKSPLSSPIESSVSSTTQEHPNGHPEEHVRGTMPHDLDLQGAHDIPVGYGSYQMHSSYAQANILGDSIHNQRPILVQSMQPLSAPEAYHTRTYVDPLHHTPYPHFSPIQSAEVHYSQVPTKPNFFHAYAHADSVSIVKRDRILFSPPDQVEPQVMAQPVHSYTDNYRHVEPHYHPGNHIQEIQPTSFVHSQQEAESHPITIFTTVNKQSEMFVSSQQQPPFIIHHASSVGGQLHQIEPIAQPPRFIEPDPMMTQRTRIQSDRPFISNLHHLANGSIIEHDVDNNENDDILHDSSQDLGSNLEVRIQEKELRKCKQERTDKGLKYLSGLIKQKIETTGNTTYEDVATALVLEAQSRPEDSQFSTSHDTENKNIRRRVYDALNVLIALGIIKKERKKIYWAGPSSSPAVDLEKKQREWELMNRRYIHKQKQLQQLEDEERLLQNQCYKNAEDYNLRESEKVYLPFMVMKIDRGAPTHVQMAEDRKHVSIRTSLTGPVPVCTDTDILKMLGRDKSHLSFLQRRDRGDLFANHHIIDTHANGEE